MPSLEQFAAAAVFATLVTIRVECGRLHVHMWRREEEVFGGAAWLTVWSCRWPFCHERRVQHLHP